MVGDKNHRIQVFDFIENQVLSDSMNRHASKVNIVKFSDNDSKILSCSNDSKFIIWNA